ALRGADRRRRLRPAAPGRPRPRRQPLGRHEQPRRARESPSGRRPPPPSPAERRSRRESIMSSQSLPAHLEGAIAVVGLSLHLPGADTLDRLWENLRDGVESIAHLDREAMAEAGVPAALLDDPRYVR